MLLHLKFFFMVIAVCVIISYTKLEKIATGIKFFELIRGSSIVHSSKVNANFSSRLGRRDFARQMHWLVFRDYQRHSSFRSGQAFISFT